jgi:hypothetical protein
MDKIDEMMVTDAEQKITINQLKIQLKLSKMKKIKKKKDLNQSNRSIKKS